MDCLQFFVKFPHQFKFNDINQKDLCAMEFSFLVHTRRLNFTVANAKQFYSVQRQMILLVKRRRLRKERVKYDRNCSERCNGIPQKE